MSLGSYRIVFVSVALAVSQLLAIFSMLVWPIGKRKIKID